LDAGGPPPQSAYPANGFAESLAYRGTLGRESRIGLRLTRQGSHVDGTYAYATTMSPIRLTGDVRADGEVDLQEQTGLVKTGMFHGRFQSDGFEGIWSDPTGAKTFPVKVATVRSAPSLAARDGKGRAAKDRILEIATSTDAGITLVKDGTSKLVNSCIEWAEAHRQGFEAPNNMEGKADDSMRVRCRSAEILGALLPSEKSFVADVRLGESSADILPAELVPTVSPDEARTQKAAAAAHRSWKAYAPKVRYVEMTDSSARFEEAHAMGAILEIVGYGDANFDGVEDLVVTEAVYATEGSYGASRLFVLTRDAAGDVLRVIHGS